MRKTVTDFRVGKKRQHKSAVQIQKIHLESEGDFEAYHNEQALAGKPLPLGIDLLKKQEPAKRTLSATERLEELNQHCNKLMQGMAEHLGLPDGYEISHRNIENSGSAIFSWCLSAQRSIDLSNYYHERDNFEGAFNHLLDAIEPLLNAQHFINEPQVNAGIGRASDEQVERSQEKEQLKELCKPMFDKLLAQGESKNKAAIEVAKWLENEHRIKKSGSTIRDWYKERKV